MTRAAERALFVHMRILQNVQPTGARIEVLQDAVMRSNVRFVATVVLNYDRKTKLLGVDDLMSEGMVGLLEAMKRFDYRRNCKFITYAVWWIRNTIINALISAYTITPSQPFMDKIRKMEKDKKTLEQELGRYLTPAEIFEASEMRDDFFDAYMAHTLPLASLDKDLFEADPYNNATLRDTIADTSVVSTDSELIQDEMTADVRKAIEGLDSLRERFIIKSYHGIGGPPMVLEEIGKSLGLTRERVRQIYWVALRKLFRNKVLASHRKDSY